MAGSEFPFVFIVLAIIFGFMKAIQYFMNKINQPEVLGEVILGFLLGPSAFYLIYISKTNSSSRVGDFLNMDQVEIGNAIKAIQFIAEFAALLLLFKVGLEVNFDSLKKVGKSAFFSAIGGIIVPLLAGFSFIFIAYQLIPNHLIQEGANFLQVALFIGAALTATSIGIATRIFLDLERMKTRAAQILVGAAVIDDIVSLTILSLTVSYVKDGGRFGISQIGLILINVALFFLICIILHQVLMPKIIKHVKNSDDRFLPLFTAMILMLVLSFIAYLLGLATIIGAFAAGVIIEHEEEEYLHAVEHDFEILEKLFVPIFFISIGLGIKLQDVVSLAIVILGLSLAIVAISAKIIGGMVGSRLAGESKVDSSIVGLSMAAKGEVTLIFAFTAFDLGVFSVALYTAVIFLVVIDSLIIPSLLKYFISKNSTNEIVGSEIKLELNNSVTI